MKIAFVFDMIYPHNVGGVEKRNWEVAKRLVKRGHEVHLYGFKFWKGSDTISREGVFLHGICSPNIISLKSGNRSYLDPLKFSIKLIPGLLKEKFDLIECATPVPFQCFSCQLVSKIKKTPAIFVWHQYFGNQIYPYVPGLRGRIISFLEKRISKFQSSHLAVSSSLAKRVFNKAKDVKIIPNGVDLEEVNFAKANSKQSDMIFVGRLVASKNLDTLIDIVKTLKTRNPKIKLIIVGKGPEEAHFRKVTKEPEFEKNIIFLGEIKSSKRVYSLLKSSKLFISTSLIEGFGLAALESNACGLPVIIPKSRHNATLELVKNKKNGIISNPNKKDLIKNIEKILSSASLRKQMSKNGIEISKKFDWDNVVNKLEKYYKEVIRQQ